MKILITGGAGFIGSHLADRLLADGHTVVALDDLSLGRLSNIAHLKGNKKFSFVKADLAELKKTEPVFKTGKFDCVYHLAANSDIQAGASDRAVDLRRTFLTTFNTFECCKKYGVREVVFASTSAIYGELKGNIAEDAGPLRPISFYGAAKLSSEAYASAFSDNADIKVTVVRFPNVVGERATHGVIYDFIRKLRKNPRELEILGDGKQKKPYLYVKDLLTAILHAQKKNKKSFDCFNLGASTSTTVRTIAETVVAEMGLKKVSFKFTGGSRGWKGDVPRFSYDLSKINRLGWKASMTSDEAMRTAVRAILANDKI